MKDGIFNCFSIYYNKNYGLIIQFNVKLTLIVIYWINGKNAGIILRKTHKILYTPLILIIMY